MVRYQHWIGSECGYIGNGKTRLYVEKANGFLHSSLLFGSSYPFRAMARTVEDFLQLSFRDEVLMLDI